MSIALRIHSTSQGDHRLCKSKNNW